MTLRFIAAVAALACLCACGPQKAAAPAAENPPASTCADDGPRFPRTDICVGRAANYIDPERLAASPPALGAGQAACDWTVNQTMLAGDEAVLYRALRCGDRTATLEFGGGAHCASLTLAKSAYGAETGGEVVRIFTSDPTDPQAAIRALIADAPAAERAKCEVQPAAREGWPKDALVIGYKKASQRERSPTGAARVCGAYGLDAGAQSYWLVRSGYAWFFTLGADTPQIDANSLTLLRKGADGSWGAAQ